MNYRGIRDAHIVYVLEGKGTPEAPFIEKGYIIASTRNGQMLTVGKVQELTAEERATFNQSPL